MPDKSLILQAEVAACLREMKLYDNYSPKFESVINRIADWCLEQADVLHHLPRDTDRAQNYFRFCIKHESIHSVGVFLAVYPREKTVAKLEICQDPLSGL